MRKYLNRLLCGAVLLSAITLNSCATNERISDESVNDERQDGIDSIDVAFLTLFLMAGILNWNKTIIDVIGTDSTTNKDAPKSFLDEVDPAAKRIAEENVELYKQKVNDFIAIPSTRIYDIGLKELLKEDSDYSTRRWSLFVEGKKVYIKTENGYMVDVTNFDADGKGTIYKDWVNISPSDIVDTSDGVVLRNIIKDYVSTGYMAAQEKLISMKDPTGEIYYLKMLFDVGYKFYNDFINQRDLFKGR